MKKVSVIVPVYNVERYLERCLDSLLAQTLEDIEIIAVDDCSNDRSPEILNRYAHERPDKIRAFRLAEKGRQGGARNLGLRKATGAYIGFTDSDDYVKPEMYQTLYDLAEKSGADIAYCSYVMDYGSRQEEKVLRDPLGPPERRIDVTPQNRNAFMTSSHPHWSGLYRRELMSKDGVFYPEGLAYEDNYFAVIVSYYAKSVIYTNQAMYYYNKTNASATTALRNSPHHMDRIKTAEMMYEFLRKQPDYEEIRDAAEYLMTELYYIHTLSCAAYHYDHPDYALIRKVRDWFLREFPNYARNQFYVRKFGRLKRTIFRINEISPELYVSLYRLYRKFRKT